MRAGACTSVDVLTDAAVIEARSRLDPAAGVMLSALWVAPTGQLVVIVHHLAVDGVSWRILLEDLNIAWAQLRGGQQVVLPAGGTSFARWASLLAEHARRPQVVEQADAWRQIAATPAVLPAVRPEVDTYVSAGQLSVELDAETTRMLLGEVPAAFHAGIHDILLIAFALAVAEFVGSRRCADRHRRGGARAPRGTGPRSRPVAHGGVVHHEISGGFERGGAPGGLDWAQVMAGEAGLGAVIKDAKEQLRALPDGVTYGVLRYLNPDVDLGGSDPPIGFNYLGRLGAAAEASGEVWRICQDGGSVTARRRGDPHAAGAHRGAQRRHGGHRYRPAVARRLDVGALGSGPRAGQPAEPVVV